MQVYSIFLSRFVSYFWIEQSFMCFTTIKNSSWVYFFLQVLLTWIRIWIHIFKQLDPDPDPHSEKLLDLDPQKMNALVCPPSYKMILNTYVYTVYIQHVHYNKLTIWTPRTRSYKKHGSNKNLLIIPNYCSVYVSTVYIIFKVIWTDISWRKY